MFLVLCTLCFFHLVTVDKYTASSQDRSIYPQPALVPRDRHAQDPSFLDTLLLYKQNYVKLDKRDIPVDVDRTRGASPSLNNESAMLRRVMNNPTKSLRYEDHHDRSKTMHGHSHDEVVNVAIVSDSNIMNKPNILHGDRVVSTGENHQSSRQIASQLEDIKHMMQHGQPILTLFTTFKNSPSKTHIYQNTIRTLALLMPHVILVMYMDPGEWPELSSFGQSLGWKVEQIPKSSTDHYPILRHMFLEAQSKYDTPYYGYTNGDILFNFSLLTTLLDIYANVSQAKQFLAVGQRINVNMAANQRVETFDDIIALGQKGRLFRTNAQDYFITTKNGFPWDTLPDFMVGKPGEK